MPTPKNEVTIKEAAAALSVTTGRIHAMIRSGDLKAKENDSPRGMYFTLKRADVEALAEQRRAIAAGEVKKERPGPKPRTTEAV